MSEENDEHTAQNTDPVSYRCSWLDCGERLIRASDGYWWICPDKGHGASHDPRRRGLRARWHAMLGALGLILR